MRKTYKKTDINYKSGTYEYRRAYYHIFVKPTLNVRSNWSEGRYKCFCCGHRVRLGKLSNYIPDVKVISSKAGFKWNNIDLNDVRNKSIFNSYIQRMILSCRKFLSLYDNEYKTILSQNIKRELGVVTTTIPNSFFYQTKTKVELKPTLTIENVQVRR